MMTQSNAAVQAMRQAVKRDPLDRTVRLVLADALEEAGRLEAARKQRSIAKRLERWTYSGDVNLEEGGVFFDLSTFKDGYVDAVRVEPVEIRGLSGAFWISRVVVNGTDDPERIAHAIRHCGHEEFEMCGEEYRQGCIVDALLSYGDYEVDNTESVQTEDDEPMECDGWRAEKRISNTSLEEYVVSAFLASE
jgi:uncharacterized protein (TIGR02996 family)